MDQIGRPLYYGDARMEFRGLLPRLAAVLALAAALFGTISGADAARAASQARGGVLDLRDWDFDQHGSITLDGEWRFAWRRFEDPSTDPASPDTTLVRVPGPWNDVPVDGHPVGSAGFATYRLTVLCSRAPDLALVLPIQHSALRLYVNGRLVASQGDPGPSKERSFPDAVRQTVLLGAQSCPISVV